MESPVADIDDSSTADPGITAGDPPRLSVPAFASSCLKACRVEWNASFEHPFVQSLIDGTLSRDRFRFYQMQDARYLESFADACSILSTRFSDVDDKLWFIDGARLALVVEKELHNEYGTLLNYTPTDIARLELTPNNRAYQSHMLVNARGASLVEAVAALAPCPWLYTDIGLRIEREMGDIPQDHPYRNWLLTYADPLFVDYTNNVLTLLEKVAAGHDESLREKAIEAFRTSTRYEWMFWDQAWNKQKWPV